MEFSEKKRRVVLENVRYKVGLGQKRGNVGSPESVSRRLL